MTIIVKTLEYVHKYKKYYKILLYVLNSYREIKLIISYLWEYIM